MLDPDQTVADVVLDHSECAQVFQHHQIDFCCHGDVSVAAAAGQRGVDLDTLIGDLSSAIAARQGPRPVDPRTLPTAQLVVHIVATHHRYLREVLPFVTGLAVKVSGVHGDRNPALHELRDTLAELVEAIEPHLDDEEQRLFPALTAGSRDPAALGAMLSAMFDEHLQVARLLARMRVAADDYALPGWACNSYRTLWSELQQLESDLFTHVHLENHVLMARFLPVTG